MTMPPDPIPTLVERLNRLRNCLDDGDYGEDVEWREHAEAVRNAADLLTLLSQKEQEIETLIHDAATCMEFNGVHEIAIELSATRTKLDAAEATQLRKYVQHTHDCRFWHHLPASGNRERCTCGLQALLDPLDARQKETP